MSLLAPTILTDSLTPFFNNTSHTHMERRHLYAVPAQPHIVLVLLQGQVVGAHVQTHRQHPMRRYAATQRKRERERERDQLTHPATNSLRWVSKSTQIQAIAKMDK